MSHVTHMNESCSTYQWFRYVAHVNESWLMQGSLTESCLAHEWVMSHDLHAPLMMARLCALMWMSHVSRIWMSHVPHVNESDIYNMWMSHGSLLACASYDGDVMHTDVNESCLTHEWVRYVSHVDESCLTCEWVMSHVWMSHVSRVNESCRTCEWVMSHMWMSHVSHVNA